MQWIVLIGGGEIRDRETERIDLAALKLTKKKNPSVLFFPTAAEDSEGYCTGFASYYGSLGCTVDHALLSTMDDDALVHKLAQADLVYLGGGDTETLLHAFGERPSVLHALRQKDGVIVGLSAGALALCSKCLITKDKDNPETKLITGLAMVPLTIEVHYDGANRDELMRWSKRVPIFAIAENAALIIGDGTVQCIGNVTYFMGEHAHQ